MSCHDRATRIGFAALLIVAFTAPVLRADIYQWKWIDPDNPSAGKEPSSTVCPEGGGLVPAPGMDASDRNLTKAYLIDSNLTASNFSFATLTNADFWNADLSNATLTGANFNSATLANADFAAAAITGADFGSTTAYGFTREQLESTYSYAVRNLSGVGLSGNDLVGWDFYGQNLSCADLSAAELSYASLQRAVLSGAEFHDAKIDGADLSFTTSYGFTHEQLISTRSYRLGNLREIDLSNNFLDSTYNGDVLESRWDFSGRKVADARFESSELNDTTFNDSNLRGASFRNATLRGVDFTNANLIGASFDAAAFEETTSGPCVFDGALVAGADFSATVANGFSEDQLKSTFSHLHKELPGIDLSDNDLSGNGWELNFARYNLARARFESAVLDGADFTAADLRESSFQEASLAGADLSNANLSGASLRSASLAGATFSGATVAGADFSNVTGPEKITSSEFRLLFESTASYTSGELSGVDLSENNLEHWYLARKNLSQARFDSSTLTGMNFFRATLAEASFQEADLSNALLIDADLSGASLNSATLAGASFNDARITAADLGSTTDGGFTQQQLSQTRSYRSHDLSGVNFSDNDLSGWDFTDQDLRNARFEYATFDGNTKFEGADIAGANFFAATRSGFTQDHFESTASYTSGELSGVGLGYCDLSDWDFSGQNLENASFDLSDLTGANLAGATLSGAYFYDSDLSGANLTGATLSGAWLEYAIFDENTEFDDAVIAGANLSAATYFGFKQAHFESTASWKNHNLSGIDLSYNDLAGWDFNAQDLSYANFTSTTLDGADFTDAVITGADFTGVTYYTDPAKFKTQFELTASYQPGGDLSGVGLAENDLSGWNFSGRNLSGAKFDFSTLDGVNFAEATLDGASFWGATIRTDSNLNDPDFSGATLQWADFYEATINNADFSRAILTGAWFTYAQFGGANLTFEDATITWADFSGVTDPVNFTSAEFREHFESTASWASGDLTGVGLGENDLVGWDFGGKILTYAWFDSSTLVAANFSGADLSGAVFWGATLGGATFDGATITWADFSATTYRGFTFDQLESTDSYQQHDLTGVGLAYNDLSGWDFSGQNLTGAVFAHSTLEDAIFDEATTVAWADFSATVENGFTKEQFESTASWASGDLTGVNLSDNDLRGWDFSGKKLDYACFDLANLRNLSLAGANLRGTSFRNAVLVETNFQDANLSRADYCCGFVRTDFSGAMLTNANLSGANLTDVDFTDAMLSGATLNGADARGAIGMAYTRAADTTNFVIPDGHVEGLHVAAGETFRVWDYDGLDTDSDGLPDTPLGITVDEGFSIAEGGRLLIGLEDGDWGSTISFEEGIDVIFDGTLEVEFSDDFAPYYGYYEWQLFDFDNDTIDVVFGESFECLLPDAGDLEHWDDSDLKSDGILRLFLARIGDADCDGDVDELDAAILSANWLSTDANWGMGNFNPDEDSEVNVEDAILLAINKGWPYDSSTAVPEPGAGVLLLVGAAVCLAVGGKRTRRV